MGVRLTWFLANRELFAESGGDGVCSQIQNVCFFLAVLAVRGGVLLRRILRRNCGLIESISVWPWYDSIREQLSALRGEFALRIQRSNPWGFESPFRMMISEATCLIQIDS